MKKIVLALTATVAAFVVFTATQPNAHGNTSAGPSGRTGSPGDGGPSNSCATAGCHTGGGNPVSDSDLASITSNIPNTGYVPGQTYTITATVNGQGKVKFGFSVSPQNDNGPQGTLIVTDANATQLNGGGKYVTHRSTGVGGQGGSRTWSFDWTAPAQGTGAVTFYGALNASNNSSSDQGDIIYLEQLTVEESTVSVNENVANLFKLFASEGAINFVRADVKGDVSVALYNTNGQLLAKQTIAAANANTVITTNGSLSTGMYIALVNTTQGSFSQKLWIK